MPRPSVFRSLIVALAALSVAGCSTTAYTSLDKSWVDPKLAGPKFKKVLILSIASDEFAQQYFQQDIAAALKKRGVNAVASQGYFTHPSPSEDARFKRVVAESDADAVLLARVVGVDEKTTVTGGYLTTPMGQPIAQVYGLGNVVASTWAPTRYVRPQRLHAGDRARRDGALRDEEASRRSGRRRRAPRTPSRAISSPRSRSSSACWSARWTGTGCSRPRRRAKARGDE